MSTGQEDAVRKNILAVIDHSKTTRTIVRELEEKFESRITTLEAKNTMLTSQVQALQVRVFSGGATG